MWKSVLSQLVTARVINTKHKNGLLTPVMLTSSAVESVGGKFFAVLLESLPANTATVTVDEEVSWTFDPSWNYPFHFLFSWFVFQGCVISATHTCEEITGYAARELCGFPLSRFIRPPQGASSLIEVFLVFCCCVALGRQFIVLLFRRRLPRRVKPRNKRRLEESWKSLHLHARSELLEYLFMSK